jgi:spore coat protein A, manganese oxidase
MKHGSAISIFCIALLTLSACAQADQETLGSEDGDAVRRWRNQRQTEDRDTRENEREEDDQDRAPVPNPSDPEDPPPAPRSAGTLRVPPVLAPVSQDATTDHYEITMRAANQQVLTGTTTEIWGFEGTWPGPTIVAERGRLVSVQQTNQLPENMTIHNHGHKVDPASDGHPVDFILPGAAKTYLYPNDQAAGTYWYHDHAMDLTGPHVYRGLAGFYLIHDPAEDALALPSGDKDVPLVLQDREFNRDNSLRYDLDGGAVWRGVLGDQMFVNGTLQPSFEVSTVKYRLRLLNGSNARNYRLAMSNGEPLVVIGSDGGLLSAPVAVDALDIAPGERFDVVVDFGDDAVGETIVLQNLDDTDPRIREVMRFVVTAMGLDASSLPAQLATIAPLDPASATVTREIELRGGDDPEWTINGLGFDPNRIDVRSQLGATEIWNIENRSGQMHPFHLHLVQFQVLSIDGEPPPEHLRGWKDTVAVPARGTAQIIMTWEGFTGLYVFHCHKLEHEDHRMMLQMSVDP